MAQGGFRTFTSTDGKTLQAKLLSVGAENITIQAANGKSYTLPPTRFSASDQTYIKKWAEDQKKNYIPSLDIKFASGKGDAKSGVDYDDRAQRFTPKVTITNRDTKFKSLPGK